MSLWQALEDEEEMQHQFKARPLDARILHSNGEFGVPKVRHSPICFSALDATNGTAVCPFKRSCPLAACTWVTRLGVLCGGALKVTPSEVTQPRPFHFATDERAAKRPLGSKDDDHLHDSHLQPHHDHHHDRSHVSRPRTPWPHTWGSGKASVRTFDALVRSDVASETAAANRGPRAGTTSLSS